MFNLQALWTKCCLLCELMLENTNSSAHEVSMHECFSSSAPIHIKWKKGLLRSFCIGRNN